MTDDPRAENVIERNELSRHSHMVPRGPGP
jgi:hypothetical protein